MLRAMQVRVRASQLVKGRRRFIDWVIEVDTVRGWRDLWDWVAAYAARPR